MLRSRRTGQIVDLTEGVSFQYDESRRAARWDLSALNLPVDNYRVRIAATAVTDLGNHPLDGNDDGIAGDNFEVSCLVTYPGDADLNGSVDRGDVMILAGNIGSAEGMTWIYGDFNGDGTVTVADYLAMKANFGKRFSIELPVVAFGEVNDGTGERNLAKSLSFTFNKSVSVAASALSLRDLATGQDIPLPSDTPFSYVSATDTARWDITSLHLPLGRYVAVLSADKITGADGVPLDGDNDGVAGGGYEMTFLVTYLGDANLDGEVNYRDYLLVKRNAGTSGGATWGQGDFNHDGAVDRLDLLAMRDSLGSSLPVVEPTASQAEPGPAETVAADEESAVCSADDPAGPMPAAAAPTSDPGVLDGGLAAAAALVTSPSTDTTESGASGESPAPPLTGLAVAPSQVDVLGVQRPSARGAATGTDIQIEPSMPADEPDDTTPLRVTLDLQILDVLALPDLRVVAT